jgi:hypothetical protein
MGCEGFRADAVQQRKLSGCWSSGELLENYRWAADAAAFLSAVVFSFRGQSRVWSVRVHKTIVAYAQQKKCVENRQHSVATYLVVV